MPKRPSSGQEMKQKETGQISRVTHDVHQQVHPQGEPGLDGYSVIRCSRMGMLLTGIHFFHYTS